MEFKVFSMLLGDLNACSAGPAPTCQHLMSHTAEMESWGSNRGAKTMVRKEMQMR
jgi:hypothetical protein